MMIDEASYLTGNCERRVTYMCKDFSKIGLNVNIFVFNNDSFEDCYGIVPYIKEPEVCY